MENKSDYSVITLSGELEMADLTDMQDCFQSIFESSNYSIALDCKGLEILLSAHLGMIYQRHQVALKRGGKIVVFGCNEIVSQAFKRLGFDRIIQMLDNESDVAKVFSS
tara:strand:- start:3059 stop:3385 length:327 start_codon:yes stop_codon:yes gene_type:complete